MNEKANPMVNWNNIDWVLLDMDGTLLDLHFDNFFWMDLIPRLVAKKQFGHLDSSSAHTRATELMKEQYRTVAGTLDWYSTDYWSEKLSLPIMELKEQYKHLIQYRADALPFLQWLSTNEVNAILVTNAHPDNLALKNNITGILDHLDKSIVSHNLNFAKEDPLFWATLTQHIDFDPKRTLFIDDSEPVLKTASDFGIQELICIRQPDSKSAPRMNLNFRAIEQFSELSYE